MDQRTITLQDGERRDVWRINHLRRASQHYGRTWLIVFDDAAEAVSRCRMSAPTARVLQWAIGHLDARQYRFVSAQAVGELLEIDRTAISRALVELERRGIIQRNAREARLSIWLCWRGTARAYRDERKLRGPEIAKAADWHAANRRDGVSTDVLKPWHWGAK
ncbi:hypothetical protein FJQ54_14695 [Sandaracinobacter neustonicus]|uniref:Uncharacterized protein n=1 Tax=Sandaracinobacter neustonicus TaxID=1715348 RepID=A0A501XEW0_9SPHN|nr:hypothetical protein [Sandaracinobacter neustonicus]TPE59046.1 hypothetical protein FJQ54_14695 [Sandaracinobacter neustonicus]